MPDIFISYSREDQPVARRVAEGLQREGMSVWWDQELAAGEEFDRVTEAALAEARAVIVLWSTHSVSSRWVRAEATQAHADGKLVPVMIEACRRPIMFELTHAAELSRWKGDVQDPAWQYFLMGLRKTLARGETTAPASATPASNPSATAGKPKSRVPVAAAAAIVLALIVAWIGLRPAGSSGSGQPEVPFDEALGQLAQLVQSDSYGAAFVLGTSLLDRPEAAASTEFQQLWQQVVLPMKPLVAEDGATVYFRPYDQPDGEWIKAGTTPLAEAVSAPRGVLSIRVEKPGFLSGRFVVANPGPSVETSLQAPLSVSVPLPLAAEGALSAGMVLVPRTSTTVIITGLTEGPEGSLGYDIPAFAIARTEVSNREFKEFVDAGGYENPAYWQDLKYQQNGRELSWNAALDQFKDTTDRPGPAGWQLSKYPDGQADMPVGGISWYEAMAYARFRGMVLPTVHHWARVAQGPMDFRYGVAAAVALNSRFGSSGPVSAATEMGMGPWGTVNTAGNVREWVSNFVGSTALAMGGAWSDYPTLALYAYTAEPMQRLPENGMRLMQPLAGGGIDPQLRAALQGTDFGTMGRSKPVSDETFESIRFEFAKDRARPTHVSRQKAEESPLWIAEEVRLEFQGRPAETFYIVKPQGQGGAPLQPVVFGPTAACCLAKRPNRSALQMLGSPVDAVFRSGRALVMPIWDGSFERFTQRPRDLAPEKWRVRLYSWHETLGMVLDYLESLPEMDSQHVGYLGYSYGSSFIAPSALALEPRIKAAVLVSGGLVNSGDSIPPVLDSASYLPRVRIPVLMINGRFDNLYPVEPSQTAMYELLGTDAGKKDRIFYDVGHVNFPPNSIARNIDDWFDKHLGPTR